MNFNDLIAKYPDESLRQVISDAYQVGYDEGVQAAAGKVVNALGELQDVVNLKAGIVTQDTWASYMHPTTGVKSYTLADLKEKGAVIGEHVVIYETEFKAGEWKY